MQKNAVKKEGDSKAVLVVGDDWPFPRPLVEKAGKWAFDAEAGREEVINRRVGRNEVDTIQTMLAIVDAQREYAPRDADGNGYADYARASGRARARRTAFTGKPSRRAPKPLGPWWRKRFAKATWKSKGDECRCPTTATSSASSRARARTPRVALTTIA